jgi:hypothetical protein
MTSKLYIFARSVAGLIIVADCFATRAITGKSAARVLVSNVENRPRECSVISVAIKLRIDITGRAGTTTLVDICG